MAGKAELEAAAQGQSIDRRDVGLRALLETPEQASQSAAECVKLVVGIGSGTLGEHADHVQIRAGKKCLFCRSENDRSHGRIPLDMIEQALERGHHVEREHVHRASRHVDPGNQDPTLRQVALYVVIHGWMQPGSS